MGHIAKGKVNANKFRFFNYHTNLTKKQNTTINMVLNEKTTRLQKFFVLEYKLASINI